jgi:hypothetical protein
MLFYFYYYYYFFFFFFFCENLTTRIFLWHSIWTEGVFVTQLSYKVGISFKCVGYTNYCFMNDTFLEHMFPIALYSCLYVTAEIS